MAKLKTLKPIVLDDKFVRSEEELKKASLHDILDLQYTISQHYCKGCESRMASLEYCNIRCPVSCQLKAIGDEYTLKRRALSRGKRVALPRSYEVIEPVKPVKESKGKLFTDVVKPRKRSKKSNTQG